jgi:hypothetical protein
VPELVVHIGDRLMRVGIAEPAVEVTRSQRVELDTTQLHRVRVGAVKP